MSMAFQETSSPGIHFKMLIWQGCVVLSCRYCINSAILYCSIPSNRYSSIVGRRCRKRFEGDAGRVALFAGLDKPLKGFAVSDVLEEADSTVSTSCEEPRLPRVEGKRHHSYPACHLKNAERSALLVTKSFGNAYVTSIIASFSDKNGNDVDDPVCLATRYPKYIQQTGPARMLFLHSTITANFSSITLASSQSTTCTDPRIELYNIHVRTTATRLLDLFSSPVSQQSWGGGGGG